MNSKRCSAKHKRAKKKISSGQTSACPHAMAQREELHRSKNAMSPVELQTALDLKIAQLECSDENIKAFEKRIADEKETLKNNFVLQLDSIFDSIALKSDEKISEHENLRNMYFEQVEKNTKLLEDNKNTKIQLNVVTEEKIIVSCDLRKTQKCLEQFRTFADELKNQNEKLVADRSRSIEDESKYRSEMKEKFESSLKDLSDKIQEHGESSQSQAQENERLRNDLQKYLDYHTSREENLKKHAEASQQQIDLFSEAKLQYEKVIKAQNEKTGELLSRLTTSLETEKSLREQYTNSVKNEKDLRQQISNYSKNFNDVKTTLSESSKMFLEFKKTTKEYSERIKLLEKLNNDLRSKNLTLNVENKKINKQFRSTNNQKESLANLCRKLQKQKCKQNEEIFNLNKRISGFQIHSNNLNFINHSKNNEIVSVSIDLIKRP